MFKDILLKICVNKNGLLWNMFDVLNRNMRFIKFVLRVSFDSQLKRLESKRECLVENYITKKGFNFFYEICFEGNGKRQFETLKCFGTGFYNKKKSMSWARGNL